MIVDFFTYDASKGSIEIEDAGILMVKEFQDLFLADKSKLKTLFMKQLTYIYLALCWKSPYSDYSEGTRHDEAMRDSGLTQEQFDDPMFRAACRKFRELQDSKKSVQLLNAAKAAADQFIDYFTVEVDLAERDQNGKPIFSAERVMKEMTQLSKVADELSSLENRVKKDMMEQSQIRADAEEGYEDFDD